MAAKTFDEFAKAYFTGGEQTIEVPTEPDKRKHLVVKHGDRTAVLYFMGLPDHLCIDIHSFVDGKDARSSVFGMEEGRKLDGFTDADGEGTSHGMPGAKLVSVLLGNQADTDTRVKWQRDNPDHWVANRTHSLSRWEADQQRPAGWYLRSAATLREPLFMSADLNTAMDRAGGLIRAWEESLSDLTNADTN